MTLPPWLHITLVVIGVAFFIIRFIQLRLLNELVLIVWISSTLLEYVSQEPEFLNNLGTAQIVMLIMFLFLTMNQKPPQNRVSAMQKLSDLASGDLDKTVGEKYQQKEDEANAKELEEEEKRRKIAQANAEVEDGEQKDDETEISSEESSDEGSGDGDGGD